MKTNHQQAFVILYAVLLVSIVLIISLSLFNIVYRQLILSATIRDSQYAFFAADSALDCVKYWDRTYSYNKVIDATVKPFGYYDYYDPLIPFRPGSFSADDDDLKCGDTSPFGGTVIFQQTDDGTDASKFKVEFNDESVGGKKLCAEATIMYSPDAKGSGQKGRSITTDGYSVACDGITNSTRAVQRTLTVTY